MGLVILLAVGGILGWLCSIILAETDRRAMTIDIMSGAGGAVLIGLLMTSGPLLSTLSPATFFFGCVGALASVGLANMVRRTSAN